MKVTIYWKTKDPETIREIRNRFGISEYMTVNHETPSVIKKEDMPLLREYETRGLLQIRKKQTN